MREAMTAKPWRKCETGTIHTSRDEDEDEDEDEDDEDEDEDEDDDDDDEEGEEEDDDEVYRAERLFKSPIFVWVLDEGCRIPEGSWRQAAESLRRAFRRIRGAESGHSHVDDLGYLAGQRCL